MPRNLFAAASHNPRVARRAGLTTAEAQQFVEDYTSAEPPVAQPSNPYRHAYNYDYEFALPPPPEPPEGGEGNSTL